MFKVDNLKNFPTGWILGAFSPTLKHTESFEVAIHQHKVGEIGKLHYHKLTTEYNLILSGKLWVNIDPLKKMAQWKELYKDDIFIFEPYDWSQVLFLEDTTLLVIRDGSNPNDKYSV